MNKVIISSLCGLMLGYLMGKKKTIIHGPNSNHIKKYIYYDNKNNKYYKFDTELVLKIIR